jgi:hypothetical protein
LRPRHRADDRLGAGTGEGGDTDGAIAHGIVLGFQILSGIIVVPASARLVAAFDETAQLSHVGGLILVEPHKVRAYAQQTATSIPHRKQNQI